MPQNYNVFVPDPSESIRNALTARGAVLQQRELEQAGQRRNLLSQALPGALRGERGAIEQVIQAEPGLGTQLYSQQQQRTQEQTGKAALLGVLAVEGAPEQQRPAIYAHIVSNLKRMDPQFQNLPDQYDPQIWPSLRAQALPAGIGIETLSKYAQEQLFPKAEPTTLQRNLLAAGLKPGTPEYRKAILEGSRGGVSVTVGGQAPLEKPVKTEVQKDIIFDIGQLGNLQKIAQDYQASFLTYGGRLKGFTSKQLEKINPAAISPEDKQALKGYTQFKQQISRVFNAYRKEITGAAAAFSEIARLKDSMINPDQSPSEFEAAFTSYQNEVARSLRLKRKFLREGIPIGDEEGGYSDQFLSGADDDSLTRGEELEAKNLSDDQIIQTLRNEGYIE